MSFDSHVVRLRMHSSFDMLDVVQLVSDRLSAIAGFDEDAIWDIGAIAGFFALSNRMVHVTGTLPNEEFYLMGRIPKSG